MTTGSEQEQKPQAQVPAVRMGAGGVQLATMEDAMRFCNGVAQSGLAPKSLDTPQKIFVALQTGLEAGLSPMASLRGVYVVGNVPAWKGETALALIRNSPYCTDWQQDFKGEGDTLCAVVKSKRKGQRRLEESTFSVADAKTAGLWGKQGPWTNHPKRMLMWRAVGHHAKDFWSDVLMGCALVQEVRDMPPEETRAIAEAAPTPTTPDPLLEAGEAQEPEVLEPEVSDAPTADPTVVSDPCGFVIEVGGEQLSCTLDAEHEGECAPG